MSAGQEHALTLFGSENAGWLSIADLKKLSERIHLTALKGIRSIAVTNDQTLATVSLLDGTHFQLTNDALFLSDGELTRNTATAVAAFVRVQQAAHAIFTLQNPQMFQVLEHALFEYGIRLHNGSLSYQKAGFNNREEMPSVDRWLSYEMNLCLSLSAQPSVASYIEWYCNELIQNAAFDHEVAIVDANDVERQIQDELWIKRVAQLEKTRDIVKKIPIPGFELKEAMGNLIFGGMPHALLTKYEKSLTKTAAPSTPRLATSIPRKRCPGVQYPFG